MAGSNARGATVAWLAVSLTLAWPATATIPYTPVAPGTPGLGPGLITPDLVPGKEYSHALDESTIGLGGVPDPEQVIAWDGIGGATDGLDFSGTRPGFPVDLQIDAIANHRDFLFDEVLRDDAHLIFSLAKEFTTYLPGAGPLPALLPEGSPPGVILKNGNLVGGSGEISYELGLFGGANGPETQGLWATQAEVNGMPLPIDVDGLEVWGPEPGLTADVDKYSLDFDALTGPVGGPPSVSVWNGTGSPYIFLSEIETAVISLLGLPPPDLLGRINLDALMVGDTVGSPDEFERDPLGGLDADRILFSIEQIADPLDPDGFYATGSELFVLDAAGGVSFLDHGGHLWDHGYALATFGFGVPGPNEQFGVFDIDAIEAVSESVVPETASLMIALAGLGLMAGRRRGG